MTSVRETSAPAPQIRAVPNPRCHCGTPLVHIPGKKTKVFCSPACKMRAKRAADKAKAEAARPPAGGAGQDLPEPKSNAGFSSKGKSPSTAGQTGCEAPAAAKKGQPRKDPRDERFARRDAHQTVSLNEAFKACGYRLKNGRAELLWKPGEATFG
ncbi:hypothetical protein, partial [Streptomyces sp. SID13726]|uniref:hypothetical protein n=1 Tax=Streptomyces sp. SID13726 TaxID=2706058 RepID=UPI00194465A1